MIVCHKILVSVRIVWDKSCRENQNTHLISVTFFFLNHAIYENVEKYSRARQATGNHIAHVHGIWIPKATDTHSECIILLFHGSDGCMNTPQCYMFFKA